jgi:hypothetical protein
MFCNNLIFHSERLLVSHPNLQALLQPFVSCPQLLIDSYLHSQERLLQPQPEDAPCPGDEGPDPPNMVSNCYQDSFTLMT